MDGDLFDRKALIVDRNQLAHVLGVVPSRISQLAREGMPKAKRGRYDLAECVQWMIGFWRERADASNRRVDSEGREQLVNAQTEYYRVRTDRERAVLIRRDQVLDVLNRLGGGLAGELDALPVRVVNRLPPEAPPEVLAEVLADECRDTRERCASIALALADAEESSGDPDPAAESAAG